MIISASRRTDIPKYYSDWFLNRIKEAYVDVRNPINHKQVSRYSLDPEIVDGIVFWTKDPSPLLARLGELSEYAYYFQFSLTAYEQDIERNLPDKKELIETFKRLSHELGPDRVIWRFDPILINEKYSFDRQINAFEQIASSLEGYTEKVIFSFIDDYLRNGKSVCSTLGAQSLDEGLKNALVSRMVEIADACGMSVEACAEDVDTERLGIEHARCIDSSLFEKMHSCKLSRLKSRYAELGKDTAQRRACHCVTSIDIGQANTCLNGCRYCYATQSEASLIRNRKLYDPDGPLLCSRRGRDDVLTDHRGTGDSRDRSNRYEAKCNEIEQTSLDV